MKKMIIPLLTMVLSLNLVGCSTNILSNDESLSEPEVETAVTIPVQGDKTSVNTVCYDTLSDEIKTIYTALLTGFENFEEEIVVEGSEESIELAYKNILADHPEIFYVSGLIYKDSSDIISRNRYTVFPSYSETEESYEEYLTRADEVAQDWINNLNTSDPYVIAKTLYQDVIENTSYVKDTTHNQDMLSVFLFNQSVCGGYCQSYAYLLQQCGIPCATIFGSVDNSSHSWVIYIIDGQYYMSDPTNGDSKFYLGDDETSYTNYSYFNILPETVSDYTSAYTNIAPVATDLNYFIKENLYFDNYNEEEIANAINTALNNNESCVTFMFSSNDLLLTAEEILFDRQYITKYIDTTTINYIDSNRFNTLTILF